MKRWDGDAQATRDAATLLPVAAAVLLLPPIILVFAAPVLVAGIPLIVVYVFGAWMLIILAAWLVARCHARAPDAVNVSDDAAGMVIGEPPDPGRRQLQLGTDGPHVAGPQRRLRTCKFVLVVRGSRGIPR